jgi:uncharacterized protein (TIGR00661 family)
MARIFYALSGDSRGHLSRAEAVVSRMPGHEFVFGGGGTVLELRDVGHEVFELPMLRTLTRDDNSCDFWGSAAAIGLVALGASGTIRKLANFLDILRPDLVISDYEVFTPLAARRLGMKCVSLSHMHVVSRCVYGRLPCLRLNGLVTRLWIDLIMSHCSDYLVSSFYELPPRGGNTTVVPPVLRPGVESISPSNGPHVLVYLPYCSPDVIGETLGGVSGEFVAYTGQSVPPTRNVTFKTYDRRAFLRDLADCRYVICSAGHSLLGEALHFGKPVMGIPAKGLFEQYLNAYHLAALGFGDYVMELEDLPERLAGFAGRLGALRGAIEKAGGWRYDRVVQALEAHLG